MAGRCRAWGCRYVVVPSVPQQYHSAAGFRRFGQEAAEIGRQLSTHGLAYHNHNFELERWDGKTGLEILFESAQATHFGRSSTPTGCRPQARARRPG